MEDYFSSSIFDESELVFTRSLKHGKWILCVGDILSSRDEEISLYFDWRKVFSQIRIGNTGSMLAIDNEDGAILSYGEREDVLNKNVDVLDIRTDGLDHAASLEDLKELFEKTDQAERISVEGTQCYAVRMKVNQAMILALLPISEISDTVRGVMSLLLLVLFFATGVCVLYSVLHSHGAEEAQLRRLGHFTWNRVLGGRMIIVALLVGIIVFFSGLFLEALLRYSERFSYCEKKVSDAVELYSSNSDFVEKTKGWFKNEYLTRSRIAGMILKQMDLQEVTGADLQKLSDSLGVTYTYVYDSDGNITVTNAPYDKAVISGEDPFHVLLEGCPELVVDSGRDEVTGNMVQKAGISLLDENNKCAGMILIVGDAYEIMEITNNLQVGNAFEQTGLTEGTSVLAVQEIPALDAEPQAAPGVGEDLIAYAAQVKNGRYQTGLESFDYIGYSVTEIGISPEKLSDNYNGTLNVLNTTQFASVKRVEEFFFLVMKPNITLNSGNFVQAAIITLLTMGVIVLIILLSCIQSIKLPARVQEQTATKISDTAGTGMEESANAGAGAEMELDGVSEYRGDNVITVLNSFLNRKKPDFEERWPADSKRWKDKTTNEKYLASLKVLLILSLLIVFFNAAFMGKHSVWYYIFKGQWSDGVTLYSVTACLADIWILFILKIVIHKLLFLSARAMDTGGETVCMLLDSFSGYVLAIIGIFLCLGNLGINAKALSLTAGVAGVIFGIACQSIVADILAGILMIFEGVVHVGDFIIFNQKPEFVMSIGVRTTRLKFFGEIMIVRNNEFKNYARKPAEREDLVPSFLTIDLNESLEHVEEILSRELPVIHDRLCDLVHDSIRGPQYRYVNNITESGMELYFTTFCKGRHVLAVGRGLNRELKLMCERNHIAIAIPKIEVNKPQQ